MTYPLTAPPPRMAALEPEEAAIVGAVRVWLMAQRTGRQCPMDAAASHLGGMEGARALRLVLVTMAAAWPDPIAIAPPCCAALTHDETTLLGMVVAARDHGRPVFDALLCEMLGQDERDRLYPAVRALALACAG